MQTLLIKKVDRRKNMSNKIILLEKISNETGNNRILGYLGLVYNKNLSHILQTINKSETHKKKQVSEDLTINI